MTTKRDRLKELVMEVLQEQRVLVMRNGRTMALTTPTKAKDDNALHPEDIELAHKLRGTKDPKTSCEDLNEPWEELADDRRGDA